MENENKQPVAPEVKVTKREKPKKEGKEAPKQNTPKKINYNREKTYIKTGIVCSVTTALVAIFTIIFISTAKSFNQELVRLYVWICVVLFVVTLLPVFVASTIALVKTSKKYRAEYTVKISENKTEQKPLPPKKVIEIVWYSVLIVLPLLITCITLTNL